MPRTSPPRKDKNNVPRAKRAIPRPAPKEAERVAKVIARAGLGSRREIEDWINEGRVAVNGETLTSPAFTVKPDDQIFVDGQPLPERERTRLFLYHKPNGVVTTNRDPEGRTTLFELLPTNLPRLVSIGRLDLNSEGLLLLTNDGGLARVLELPETSWLRRYRVRAKGAVNQAQLDGLIKGITVEGIEYGSIEATLDRVQGANVWITVALREGKNREVRNVLGALGLQVNRLIRVSYGPFQLGDIAEGGVEEVRTRILRDQLGDDITAAAQADFNGPLIEREEEERPASRRPTRAAEAAPVEKPVRGRRAAAPEIDPERPPRVPLRKREPDDDRKIVRVGTVADRKGRAIKVERKLAPLADDKPTRRPRGEGRGPSREEGEERPFRRPAGRPERGEGREERGFGARRSFRDGDGEGRAPRAPRSDRSDGGGRPPRGEGRGGEGRGFGAKRSFRDGEGEARAPRGARPAGAGRPPRGGDAPRRGPRDEGREADAYPFKDRIERSSWRADDDRPARDKPVRGRPGRDEREGSERPFRAREDRAGGKPSRPRSGGPRSREAGGDEVGFGSSFGERPARGRPARSEGGERPFRQREERAPGTFKPRFAKSRDQQGGDEGGFGGRGGRPAGKPGGFKSGGFKAEGRDGARGGKPGGFKSGGKPGGFKPGGGKGGPSRGGPSRGGKPQGPRSRG
ncbi:pseudouridine synthase [Xanthobacteraceae bacterium A53D]